MIRASRTFIFLTLFVMTPFIRAAEVEQLGRFEISEFALSPRLHLMEPGEGGFELSQSWIGFEWSRDEFVRGVLKLGSSDLDRPVIWYSPLQQPSFGVSEAWMEGRSLFGDVRAGLLAIPQSFEGLAPDWSSVLPETRARREGWFIKRDFGLQFRWHNRGWQTSITVHNGESADNKDGKYFVTGHWQLRDFNGNGLLATASVGHTRPASTSSSEAALPKNGFVFDPKDDAKIRQGSFALFHEEQRNLFLIEVGKGEILQGQEKNSFAWGHADVVYNAGGDLSYLLRYEQMQPDQKNGDSLKQGTGAGLAFASRDNLQTLTLFASHNQESPEVASDELWLIFRIHSAFAR